MRPEELEDAPAGPERDVDATGGGEGDRERSEPESRSPRSSSARDMVE